MTTTTNDEYLKKLVARLRADLENDKTDRNRLFSATTEIFLNLVESGANGEEIATIGYFLNRFGDSLQTGALIATAIGMTMMKDKQPEEDKPYENKSYG